MSQALWIGVALAAAVVAVLAIATRRRGEAIAASAATPRDPQPLPLDRVAAALRAGNKIEAIQLLRESSGLGLAEAKQAVERIERGLPAAAGASLGDRSAPSLDAASFAAVRAALDAGDGIAAIKIYRERTGVGLKEAKEAVDALRARR